MGSSKYSEIYWNEMRPIRGSSLWNTELDRGKCRFNPTQVLELLAAIKLPVAVVFIEVQRNPSLQVGLDVVPLAAAAISSEQMWHRGAAQNCLKVPLHQGRQQGAGLWKNRFQWVCLSACNYSSVNLSDLIESKQWGHTVGHKYTRRWIMRTDCSQAHQPVGLHCSYFKMYTRGL